MLYTFECLHWNLCAGWVHFIFFLSSHRWSELWELQIKMTSWLPSVSAWAPRAPTSPSKTMAVSLFLLLLFVHQACIYLSFLARCSESCSKAKHWPRHLLLCNKLKLHSKRSALAAENWNYFNFSKRALVLPARRGFREPVWDRKCCLECTTANFRM